MSDAPTSPDSPGPGPARPHPATGRLFSSPVPPGTGWPGDPAEKRTPVAVDAASVVRLADPAVGLAEVSARVSVCRACPRLVAWREQVAVEKRRAFAGEPYWGRPSTGFGDPQARVLVVGLAPAANGANRTGRVFTGDRSGEWLFAALHAAGLASASESRHAGDGLTLRGARVVPAVRCAPPANSPTPAERDTCAPWLRAETELLWATVRSVVPLGRFAWDAVLRLLRDSGATVPRPAPRFGHGVEAVLGRPGGGEVALVASFHPSQQNTFTGRLTLAMLTAVLRRAAELADPGARSGPGCT